MTLKRFVPQVAGLAVTAGCLTFLVGGPVASAVADTTTYTGYVELVNSDNQIVGCVASAAAAPMGYTTDPTSAVQVTTTTGTAQNLVIVGGSASAPDLGLEDSDSAGPMTPSATSWTFVSPVATTDPGSPTVNDAESAVWSLDPQTRVLTPSWVYDDGTSTTLGTWIESYDSGLEGGSNNVADMEAQFPGDVVGATFVLGSSCSGAASQPQTITFTSAPATTTYPGQAYTATATGGASGNAVTFSSATPQVCSVDATSGAVSFLVPGTCTIDADQAAAPGFDAAPTATQDVTVSQVPSHVTVSTDTTAPVTGQSLTATATVTVDSGTLGSAGGSVQFALDGTDLGSAVAIGPDGTATAAIPTAVGSHSLTATYAPADSTDYTGSDVSTPVTVVQAATTTVVTARPKSLVATVAAVAPGAGSPTGNVTFSVAGVPVGTAPVSAGKATLLYTPSAVDARKIAAVYSGDSSFLGSSGSTSRSKPVLTAHLSSARPGKHGWYRGPVTVSFTCDADGSTLLGSCPAPVRLSHQPGGSVTRTIKTADGGVATKSVTVRIDAAAPRVSIGGVRAGGNYFAVAPKATCTGGDRVSGLASCVVRSTRHGSRVVVTATAKDVAGNVAKARSAYTILNYAIEGATLRGGVWQIHHGSTYTLVALGSQPRYVDASVAPTRPSRLDSRFHRAGSVAGHRRWAIGVTMSMTTIATRNWELGIEQGGHVHVLRVHVIG